MLIRFAIAATDRMNQIPGSLLVVAIESQDVPYSMSLERRTGPEMSARWSLEDEFDEFEIEEEVLELAQAGRGKKAKKKAPARVSDDFDPDDREEKRRKRRWEVPPHKRISDHDAG